MSIGHSICFLIAQEGHAHTRRKRMNPNRNHALSGIVHHIHQLCGCFISLVAEDLPDIPKDFRINFLCDDDKEGNLPALYLVLYFARNLGKGPVKVSRETLEVLSIEGRVKTFRDTWGGPQALEMAKAGFVFVPHERMNMVHCAYGCGKMFRFHSPDEDPWMTHKTISPNCPYLRALCDHGANPSPLGRKRWCHSTTSLHEFTREPV